MMRRYILVCCILMISIKANAQKLIGNEQPAIKVIGTVTKDAIMLRWAANTPLAWKRTNQYGYIIERRTIAIGQEILKDPIVKKLTPTPIMPKPLMEWETLVDQNDNAAVAAQALYGEDFDVEMEEGGSAIMQIANQAKALEQRFSFALYAADQDFEVAKFSGLGYVDTDVKPGEKYLYRVYAAIPPEKMKVDFGGVYFGLDDYRPLPEPLDFTGIFGDKNVMLSWNYTLLKRQYNSYIIERSEDGKNYTMLGGIPTVNMNEREKDPSDRMFFIDSIPQNNKKYYYRIKGISSFGETGPVSKEVSGMGVIASRYNPAITEAKLQSDNRSALITWEFPQEGLESISHFELNRSDNINKAYRIVVPNISKNTRSTIYKPLNTINYFTITAVGMDGNKRISFPQMVQPVDDTPPAIPLGLTGAIDSTGVVQLQWQKNLEGDFLGYRVFKANLEDEEFTQITFDPIPESKMIDTVMIKSLNNKVYYKIQAFDKRFNPSGFSEVLELKKPDIIPPTQPVFASFKADQGIVALNWITSSSIDAEKTLIYRKEQGAKTSWELTATVDLPGNSYEDTTAKPQVTYLYTLLTRDESGLESKPIAPISITLPDNKPKATINKFLVTVNREEKNILLNWRYDASDVMEFLLFRAEEDGQPTLYKVFKEGEEKFFDRDLRVNTKYTYLLQAVLISGATSPLKKVAIEY